MFETIDGVRWNYGMTGTGETKVLLLHGWGCDGTLMRPVAERLADRHLILFPDFPGHGKSDRPPGPWGIPEYGEQLEKLLKSLNFLPCAVIAHSFGARVAVWLSVNRPECFTQMILTGAAGIRPPLSEEARKRSESFRKKKKIAESMEKSALLAPLAEMLMKKIREKYGSRDYNALDAEMRKTFVKVISQDLLELYDRIQQPTLLIWGEKDTETPLWMGREMEKRIPDSGLVLFENGTHFAYLEQIERFSLIARQFLVEE